MPVHFGGKSCDMDQLNKIAKQNKIKIIEDAAHALPTFYKKNIIGSGKNLVCFSFYANKTLTTGEGGMIVTDSYRLSNLLTKKRLHGISRNAWNRYSNKGTWNYDVKNFGYKYNPNDISSAIGIVQLQKQKLTKKRMLIAKYKISK